MKPDVNVFALLQRGKAFTLDPSDNGSLPEHAARASRSSALPSVVDASVKTRSLRKRPMAIEVDLSGGTPIITPATQPGQLGTDANAKLLPDGSRVVDAGSSTGKSVGGAGCHAETCDPQTGL